MKNGIISLVPMFPSCVMVLKLSKKVYFFKFCADLSKTFTGITGMSEYTLDALMNTCYIKGATKLQTKDIFVSTTKKAKNTANILNWCILQ